MDELVRLANPDIAGAPAGGAPIRGIGPHDDVATGIDADDLLGTRRGAGPGTRWVVIAGAGVAASLAAAGGTLPARVALVVAAATCAAAAALSVRDYLGSGARRDRPLGRGIALVEAGLLVLLVGTVAGGGVVAPGGAFGWAEQATFVVAVPLLVSGLIALPRGRAGGWDFDSLLESALGPSLVAFVVWAVVLEQRPRLAAAPLAFGLARPAIDLLLVFLAARQLPPVRGQLSPRLWRCFAAGGALLFAGDLARSFGPLGATPVTVRLIGPLLVAAWTLFALGGLDPGGAASVAAAEGPARLAPMRLGIVMPAVAAGPVVLVIELSAVGQHIVQIAIGSMVLSALATTYLVRRVKEGSHIEHLALHDDLTGLPNRVLFADRVGAALAQAERSGDVIAVMFLDLDRFKNVNDSLGHAGGNDLLRLVGRRLRQAVRDEDTVARLGGDEFTILLPRLEDSSAIVPAERVLDAFVDPFRVAGRDLFVSPSIGIALGGPDGHDVETLLKNADAAMYRAKNAGRNTFRFYTRDMNAQAHRRLAIESSLHTAIDRGELALYYQPKVDIRSGCLVGTEALARWHHRDRGLILPDEFIPLAEETGLIARLGSWALETACAQTQRWREAGTDLTVAVNLSPRQFLQQELADVVARVLRSTRLDPEALELELTESVALEDPASITATLHDLKRMGVACSIDDFGTGYSGLSYLTRLPIDTLKIDKVFIGQIAEGEGEARIVAAVIALAHELRMKVIAEGVETEEQLAFLQQNGCDTMQGYLVSRPLPVDEFSALLETIGPSARLLRPSPTGSLALSTRRLLVGRPTSVR